MDRLTKIQKSIWERHATWELEAIRKALSTFQVLNTPEENARLAAVEEILYNRSRGN
jgi:hypothetical protein